MKNLDKEILRQLSLISYDRSLILSEQKNNTPLVVSEQITKKVVKIRKIMMILIKVAIIMIIIIIRIILRIMLRIILIIILPSIV